VQAPLTQAWPAAHALPHIPQLAWSFVSFTHVAPQRVSPMGHVVVHLPDTHA
jgi:hypothetical protein